jgi:formate hydrogenlyase transcriptional activator
MRAPESHLETDLTFGPVTNEPPEMAAPASRSCENGAVPEHQDGQEDLEKALNESKKSETRLRKIIDTIPTLAWCTLPDGSNEFLSQRWHDYTGVSPDEARCAGWKIPIHPEDLPGLAANWEALPDSDKPGEYEVRLRRSDGVYLWFLLRFEALRDETGEIIRWYGAATDIDQLKRTQSLRAAEKRTLEMIADGASLKDILNNLCSFIDVEASPVISTVLLMDADGERLWHTAGTLVPRDWLPVISPLLVSPHAGCCGEAVLLKKRVIVADVATDINWLDEFRDLAIKNGIRAAWSEPILTKDGEVLGTFALYSPEPRIPTDTEIAIIEGAGHIALIAIERQRSQEALRKAVVEIQESEATLRQTIDTVPTLAWSTLPDGFSDFLNQRWHEYTGLAAQESHGWGWQVSIHPEDLQRLMDLWRKILESGDPGEVEARLRRHDGEYRWFLFRTAPFRDQFGKIVKWYGTNTDIDDLKRAEEKLRQDETELRQIVDLIPQIIIVIDPQGTPLYANRVALDYLELSPAELPFAGFGGRFSHPEDIEKYRTTRQQALARGLPFELEQRILGKHGSYRWFLFRYNGLRDEHGKVSRWYVTATDIHDRKHAEEKIQNENLMLREEIVRSSLFEEIVGSSEALRQVLIQVSKVAPTDSTVLILGETGTGKELIARAIHNRSKRSNRAFIRVNCAAIPPSLIASELFGHEKGSFTGALQRRLGRFESADGGTLFLDEVGELPLETQVALLRVLQEREFERVGGSQTVSVDVRILAATNRDLSAAVTEGTFRQDLFYRLNVFPIRVPALRERVDDIPLLVEYLVDRYAQKAGKRIRTIKKATLTLFQTYDWPGNIRELQNVIERAVILCEGDTFEVDDAWLTRAATKEAHANAPLIANLAEREKEVIENALRETRGQISGPAGAAAKLGIARQTLESKIKKLGVNRYRFKTA